MQPLDVGVYGPMKENWRGILRKYKDENPSVKILNKCAFPGYLKELDSLLEYKELLPSVFEKCGLCPMNSESH